LDLLTQDIRATWNIKQDGSYYFNGKAAQKYASLCLMASDVSIVGQDNEALKTECVQKLQSIYTHYLENTWTFPLIYDEVYRGLSSSEGFKLQDPWKDFGNSAFNDHHYHYGYWITASAMLKFLDPQWSRMQELDDMVHLMIRDTANPSRQDQWFPRFRHFDWFVGHSYSHGVSPFADGKDQESTSEEVNFHYGLMLWGKVSGNANIEEMGKLMLKVNIRAINHYFLMADDNVVHPKEFIPNKVTGIFFDNKCDYATWFGPNREYIHGIQMIPVSPINELYRKKEFVVQEWEQVLSKIDIIQDPMAQSAWQSLIYANAATVDQTLALEKLATVPMDDGLSRSWALYYAATRPTSSAVR
jgi:endo-1,3(4)-beta-glucanase